MLCLHIVKQRQMMVPEDSCICMPGLLPEAKIQKNVKILVFQDQMIKQRPNFREKG